MKILAPLRHSSEVGPLGAAGADEFYCGLTPPGWAERFGAAWVHRRNPFSAGVPGLEDLREAVRSAGPLPVYVTVNAPSYPEGSVPFLVEFAGTLLPETGVAGLIVADLDLLLALAEAGLGARLHLSSLAACTNGSAAAFFREVGISRVILPRHLTLAEIEAIVASAPGLETEVFLLNDGCVFEEGLCATTHGAGPFCVDDAEGNEALPPALRERYAFWKWTLDNCGCRTSLGYQLGPCGLCALPRFLELGVTSLKVVGREASLARKVGSVRLAAAARRLALAGKGPEAIRDAVVELRGAANLCEGALLCYYPDVWARAPELREEERRCCA
ncbi:MAG: U32 family peptidase [Deltaproteobacteria bacterium]|nr:U32 family peptidase [Deltaproteobacteria bacterium]